MKFGNPYKLNIVGIFNLTIDINLKKCKTLCSDINLMIQC